MTKKVGRPPHLAKLVSRKIIADWIDNKPAETRLPAEEKLAQQYGVSRRTIRAVLEFLERNGHVVRRHYGGLFVAPQSSHYWRAFFGRQIGVTFSDFSIWMHDPFCIEVLESLVHELHRAGLDIKITTESWTWPLRGGNPVTVFSEPAVVGLILVGRQSPLILQSLPAFKKPVVSVDIDLSKHGVPSYCFDNRHAGSLLAERLLALGHRRVCAVFESPERPADKRDEAWNERRKGFLSVFQDNKLPPPDQIFLSQRNPDELFLKELIQRLQMPPDRRPSALFLPSDWLDQIRMLAAGLRIKIPRDLTVVGCAGTERRGPLTGMRFNGHDLGAAAAMRLLHLVRDPKWQTRKAIVTRIKGHYSAGESHAKPLLGGFGAKQPIA